MSDRPDNAGDQPAPAGPLSQEPVAPGFQPGHQAPAWASSPAPAWASPQAPTEAALPAADQTAAEVPAGDAGEGWPSQPAPYGGAMLKPPPPAGGGGRNLLWPILSVLLLLAFLGTAAFAFVTYSDLNKTKDSLSSAQSARQEADAKVSALKTCVTSMKTDEAALQAALDRLDTLAARAASGGDVDAARKAYESALRTAEVDFRNAALGFNHGQGNEAAWNAAIALYLQAQGELATAQSLQTTLDSLVTEYTTAMTDAAKAVQAAEAQMAKTATQCNAATA